MKFGVAASIFFLVYRSCLEIHFERYLFMVSSTSVTELAPPSWDFIGNRVAKDIGLQLQMDNQNQNIKPPQFIAAGVPGGGTSSNNGQVQSKGTPSTLNLDDIFGDCFFTPEGEAIFLSENPQIQQQVQQQQQLAQQQQNLIAQGSLLASGEGSAPAQNASRPTVEGNQNAGYTPVPQAGGIVTTGLDKPKAAATVMGNVSGSAVAPSAAPMAQAPQRPHHLQYAYVQASGGAAPGASGAKRGRPPVPAPTTTVAKTDAQAKADRT